VGLSAVGVEVGGCRPGVDGLGVELGGELEVVIDEGLLGLARQIRRCHVAPPSACCGGGGGRRDEKRRPGEDFGCEASEGDCESRIIELSLVDAGPVWVWF
jgi:hypothetical protein